MDPEDHSDAIEGRSLDRKSLRLVTGKTADFNELAKDCVCFANGSGGQLLIGIEDDATAPPATQRVPPDLLDRIRKRVAQVTVNVMVLPELRTHSNGGEYVSLSIPRSPGVASTSDGRYYLRVGDSCLPVVGDDVLRLANDRSVISWEAMTSLGVSSGDADSSALRRWTEAIRASSRVKTSVREKSAAELLVHYDLAVGETLTNLGVLMIGSRSDRAKLGTAPIVQAIRYDEREEKIWKEVWDDHTLSPVELVDAVRHGVPDFEESYELPEGLLRVNVPAYDESVVRELLVNALVHRPYTQRGDIFLSLYPDRLEIVNVGPLPLGISPDNILHRSRRRNDGLARVFHDLGLMEKEGSGFDMMYERLLSSGRAVPVVTEDVDLVRVVVQRRIVHPGVLRLLTEVDRRHDLTQRERIALGTLAQTEGMSAEELSSALELRDDDALRSWVSRLEELGLVERSGRARGTRYFVAPPLLRETGLDGRTTLVRIEPHRLQALVVEDVERYPNSAASDIHRRIGSDVPKSAFRRALKQVTDEGRILPHGERRWRRYHPRSSIDRDE